MVCNRRHALGLAAMFLLAFSRPSFGQADQAPADSGLTLEQCVALALESHPQLAGAGAQVDEARGLAYQAGLYPNPRLDSGNPQVIGRSPSSVYSVGVTQEIVSAGKLRLKQAAATESARQTEWELTLRRIQVITTVRQSFFATVGAQRRQALFVRLAEIAEKSEATSQALMDAGRVSEADVLLLRVERRRAENSLRNAATYLNGKRRELAAVMGRTDLQIASVSGSLNVPMPDFDDDAVLVQVIESNPQAQIAAIDVNRALFELRRAEVEPIPNVQVQGGYQYQQNSPHGQALVGVYLDIPLWNRNQGNIQAASASVRRSAAQREIVRNDLTRQLTDALMRYRVASQTAANYEESILPDARRTLDLVRQAYQQGEFDISQILQAQKALFEANLDFVNAQENRVIAASDIAGLLMLEDFPGQAPPAVPPAPQ